MTVSIVGVRKEIKEGTSVAELIALEKVENPEYVTVSVNEEFIQKDDFEKTVLKESDSVEVLYFMGGGQ